MRGPIEEFRDAILATGLQAPGYIRADGILHRFASTPGRSDKPGWYVLHLDGIPAGTFGCWRNGFVQSWRDDTGRTLASLEGTAHRTRIAAARQQREAEKDDRQKEAAKHARHLWEASIPAEWSHPYRRSKCIEIHDLRQWDRALLVPISIMGELVNLQFIRDTGAKSFLKGGRVAGAYHVIGGLEEPGSLYVCEGFATGATIREETSHPVVCALSAGNLSAVATNMRARYPNRDLVIAADNDRFTENNPGMAAALHAAKAASARITWPVFPETSDGTDFNDLRKLLPRTVLI